MEYVVKIIGCFEVIMQLHIVGDHYIMVLKGRWCFAIKKYRYEIYGLVIESDFMHEELVPSDKPTQVTIINGKVPIEFDHLLYSNDHFKASKNEFLFRLEGVAKYYISNGNKIIVEPYEGADLTSVKLYILGTSLGVIQFQRGVFPIHGSAAVIDQKGVIITGVTGAGKSTLSMALRQKGYSFLTDDVAAVHFKSDGTPWVAAGFPQQKLKSDSAQYTGVDVSSLRKVNVDLEKYYVPVDKGFIYTPKQLMAVCEIIPSHCEDISIQKVYGTQKLTTLMNHTYRAQLIPFFKMEIERFKYCSNIAQQIQVFQMIRPINKFTLEEQIEYLVKELGKSDK
jgi:hypothetical protein